MITKVITKIHMKDDRSGIERVWGVTPGPFGNLFFEESKQDVIWNISRQIYEYRTYKVTYGKEDQGPLVRVILGRFSAFLRTDPDNIESDNLGELPEY